MQHYIPTRTYETTFILRPTLNDSEVEELVNSIKDSIEGGGHEVVKVDLWGRRKMAYPIGRYNDGVYAFIVFNGTPEFIPDLERQYQINENVIRFLTIRSETAPEEIKVNLDDRPPRDRNRGGRPARPEYRAQPRPPREPVPVEDETDDDGDDNDE